MTKPICFSAEEIPEAELICLCFEDAVPFDADYMEATFRMPKDTKLPLGAYRIVPADSWQEATDPVEVGDDHTRT